MLSDTNTAVVKIALPADCGLNAKPGGVVFGKVADGAFKARVVSAVRNGHEMTLEAVILEQDPGLRCPSNETAGVDASVWIREQRALSILLERTAIGGKMRPLLDSTK